MSETPAEKLEAVRVLMCEGWSTEASVTGGWEVMDREGSGAKPVVRVENLDEAFQVYVYAPGTYAVTYDLHLSDNVPKAVLLAAVLAILTEEFQA